MVKAMTMNLKEGKCQSCQWPPLPSRSSSFYMDGNGRTLIGNLVEREEPIVSASGSVATTVASRAPSSTR